VQEPAPEQTHRAATLGRWFLDHLPGLFGLDRSARDSWIHIAYRPSDLADRERKVQATLEALGVSFPAPHLGEALVDFICLPLATGLAREHDANASPSAQAEREWFSSIHAVAFDVARQYVSAHPTAYLVQSVATRLEYMLTHVVDDTEKTLHPYSAESAYYRALPRDCMDLLFASTDLQEARDVLHTVAIGSWNLPVVIPGAARQEPRRETSYQAHAEALGFRIERLDVILERDNRLDYDTFVRLAELFWPDRPMLPRSLLLRPAATCDSPLQVKLRSFGQRYLRRLASDLGNAANWAWSPVSGWCGIEWLERACEHIERESLRVVAAGTYHDAACMIRSLANISALDDGETIEVLTSRLRRFSAATLKAVLPHTERFSAAVLDARGWRAVQPLDALVRRLAGERHQDRPDIPNGGGVLSGVVDRAEIVAAVSAAGEPLAREYLALLKASKVAVTNTLVLVEAVCGWNAQEVFDGLGRDRQIAIKAYGLLPCHDDADTLERYSGLREIERGARDYGPERRLNTETAVEVALENLARTAGYADRLRLEWAMEARLAGEARTVSARRRVQDWEIELVFDDQPRIVVRRNGRALKSTPAAVRKSAAFAELNDALSEIKAQGARVRLSLERIMIDGDAISGDDLRLALGMPAVSHMLSRLVVRAADGTFGLCRADGTIETVDGRTLAVSEITIAHPWYLAERSCLRDWQKAIVQRRIVQPFKQVFRELYLLAPGEERALHTARFAGHQLEPKRVFALMHARGWRSASHATVEPAKPFASAGVHAHFDFPDAGHYMAETERVTSGAIRFVRAGQPVSIASVPPVLLSEVLRDADLIVSAAALAGAAAWSAEAAERRADVARAVLGEFGVGNVAFDGTFARVTGRRASYRIHLGSGVVHVNDGANVCTVPPGHAGQAGSLFLPFPAGEDVKTAEVVSLILLFANDDRITDAGLLAQIGRS
jgi:uncharacterized protein DUF4132/uncharacterized protein DUF5724